MRLKPRGVKVDSVRSGCGILGSSSPSDGASQDSDAVDFARESDLPFEVGRKTANVQNRRGFWHLPPLYGPRDKADGSLSNEKVLSNSPLISSVCALVLGSLP